MNNYPLPPTEVIAILEDRKESFLLRDITSDVFTYFGHHPLLPQYYCKGSDTNRLKGRQIIAKCIEDNNLNCIAVPQKYIYRFREDCKTLVLAEYIEEISLGTLSSEEITQLTIVKNKTGFVDFRSNIRKEKNGLLFIIDTELDGFIDP